MKRFCQLSILCCSLAASAQTAQIVVQPNPVRLTREKGLTALDDRQYTLAVKYFTELQALTRQQPTEFLEATILLVETHCYAKAFKQARQTLADYLKVSSGTASRNDLRQRFNYWLAYTAAGLKQFAEAEEIYRQLLDEKLSAEMKLKVQFSYADALVQQEKYEDARQIYYNLRDFGPRTERSKQVQLELIRLFLIQDQDFWAKREIESQLKIIKAGSFQNQLKLLMAIILVKEKQTAAALSLYREAAAPIPDQPNPIWYAGAFTVAEALEQLGEYETAITLYRHALLFTDATDQQRDAQLRLIYCLTASGNTAEATSLAQLFHKTFPENSAYYDALFNLAGKYAQLDQSAEAEKLLKSIMADKQTPQQKQFEAALLYAELLKKNGQLAASFEAFLAAEKLGLTPTNQGRAHFLAAETALANGDKPQARQAFSTVSKNYPQTEWAPKALFNEALILAELGEFEAAMKAADQIIKKYPNDELAPSALFESARFLTKLNRLKESANRYKKLFTTYPDHEQALTARLLAAENFTYCDALEEAGTILQETLNLSEADARFPEINYKLIQLYELSGSLDKAIETARNFTATYPNNPLTDDVILWLGDQAKNQGNEEEAKGFYNRLLKDYAESDLAPAAYFELALLQAEKEPTEAIKQFKALPTTYPKASKRLKILALMESGEQLTILNKLKEAAEQFAAVNDITDDSGLLKDLKLHALGRQADIQVQIAEAEQNEEELLPAIENYRQLLQEATLSLNLMDQTRYKLAVALNRYGQTEEAEQMLEAFILDYRVEQHQGLVRDWKYFGRAVFLLTDLYLSQMPELDEIAPLTPFEEKERRRLKAAAKRVLEKAIASKLPIAAEAKNRLRQINALK